MNDIILSPVPLEQLKSVLRDAIRQEILIALTETTSKKLEDEYLTRVEVAQLLSISPTTVAEWTKSGKITGYRIGRRVRFKKADITNCLSKIKTQY